LKENFDRFNFAIYKEKEMVEFRRWITALAVLALFAGLASAQVGGGGTLGGPLICSATVAVPPQLRTEGMTELIGDIVITCTGGTATAVGTAIPTANFTVSLGTQVTSRLLGNNSVSNASEALLLIDEPGVATLPAPVLGFGPQAPQSLCATPAVGAGSGGCVEYAANAAAVNGGTLQVASSSTIGPVATFNVFQGLVTSNQVTFQGIPILAPVSSGAQRIFRITNIRANVSGLGTGSFNGTTPLLASVSISGSTSVPINNPVQTAGFIQPGLTVTFKSPTGGGLASAGTGFLQCTTATTLGVAVLQYTENFGTAFKTRVAPTATYTGQAGAPPAVQNIPGTIYNSESGFVTSVSGLPANTGLADYGTRLKAVFNNVPAGVKIYVSVVNLASPGNMTSLANAPLPAGNTNTSSYAILVNGEASPDANGFPPALTQTTSVNSSTTGIYDITSGGAVAGASYVAVWEVMNTNPNSDETFSFGVWTSYTANPGSGSPPQGTATVSASYAPTPPVPFTTATGSAASSSLTIPRFADLGTYDNRNVLVINICQTLLLFPFVTNQSGFDTGFAIANTSSDPIGTGAQNGTCTMTFYDGTGKTPAFTTPNVATGTVYVNLASVVAPGFQGYAFVWCNFQFAHGYGIVSDIGARNFAAPYLALVINNGSNPNNRNQSIASENASH